MATRPELAALHLCSGYGGFELITRLAGIPTSTVAHVERDSHAAAVLVARMGEASLGPAPIWDDLTTFDGAAWRGRVDLITAGFPCQPFSAAGEGRGVDDERWIWPDIARIIADVGPRYVFVENVPGLIRHGLPHVLSDLAELGFDAEWGCLAASAVGAPHKRERVWLWATLGNAGSTGGPAFTGGAHGVESAVGRWPVGADVVDGAVEDVADTESVRRVPGHRPGAPRQDRRRQPQTSGSGMADTESTGRQGAGERQPQQPEPGDVRAAWPPRRDDPAGWDEWIARGGPQPLLRREPDGPTGRLVRPGGLSERLHALGNGLVPQAGAHAVRQLIARSAPAP